MENVTLFGPIGTKQKRDLEYFAKKDNKTPEKLGAIAIDQYLEWRKNQENYSCSYKPPSDLTNVTIFIPSSVEIHDKLRELTNKGKVRLSHLIQHALHLYLEKRSNARIACPHCSSEDYEVRNYNQDLHDGDMYCKKCGTYIRMFDAG